MENRLQGERAKQGDQGGLRYDNPQRDDGQGSRGQGAGQVGQVDGF